MFEGNTLILGSFYLLLPSDMAAAISPANRTESGHSISPLDTEAKHSGICFGDTSSDQRFKLNICPCRSPLREVSGEETITNKRTHFSLHPLKLRESAADASFAVAAVLVRPVSIERMGVARCER